MNLLKFRPYQAFLLVYSLGIVQLALRGVGVDTFYFMGHAVGLFPALMVYFIWLFLLFQQLKSRVSPFISKYNNLNGSKMMLLFVLFIFLPSNFIYTNVLYRRAAELDNDADPALLWAPIMGLISIVGFVFLILIWLSLSKLIFIIQRGEGYKASFRQYAGIFLYFFLGPFGIWSLQSSLNAVNGTKRLA